MSGGGARRLRKLYEKPGSGKMKAEAVVTARNNELRHCKRKIVRLEQELSHADAAGYARGLQVSRDAVNALIVPGELPGNGCDLHAQRNGYIIAANTLFALKPAQGKEG